MSYTNKSTVANNRVYFWLPFHQLLSATNLLQYFPIFGSDPVSSSTFATIDLNIGKKFYCESLKVIVSANGKDSNTVYSIHDVVGIRGSLTVPTVTNGEFQIVFPEPLVFENDSQMALSIDTSTSTAGNIRTNLFYALCYYLTQEEA